MKKMKFYFIKVMSQSIFYLLVSGIAKLYTHDFKDNEVVVIRHNLIGPALIAEIMNYEEMGFFSKLFF